MQGNKRSEYVYRGKVVSLRIDTYTTEDGREIKREIVEHRGAVAIVPRLDNETILLIRQFRPAVGEYLLEIPAGTCETEEDADETANRELEEEIGYRAGKLRRMFSQYLAPGYSSEVLHAYLGEDLTRSKKPADEDEVIEVVPVKTSDIDRLILDGSIRDAKSIAALLVALRLM